MNEEQRAGLAARVKAWRVAAAKGGTLHGLWDCIFDAEALLEGKPAICTADQLIAIGLDGKRGAK